jgi:aldose sugar dehydrogenase
MRHQMFALLLLLPPVSGWGQSPDSTLQQSALARFRVEPLLQGLSQPVAMVFLPGGQALIAERNTATLSRWDGRSRDLVRIQDLPPIVIGEDAGIFDVILHPRFQDNGWIYLSYCDGIPERSTLAVDRFKLVRNRITGRERLFTANAYSEDLLHHGGRLAIRDSFLFITIGDRHHQDRAQELTNHAGTIARLHDDGRVPTDNPFVGRDNALPEIWSYGHRNPLGLVFHPTTGDLWSHEHGPLAGDELNLIRRGANYGWPVISYGWEYEGGPIGKGIVMQDGMEQPLWAWSMGIAPSGMLFYQGTAFPGWQGSLFSGAMSKRHLNRLEIRDGRVVLEERLMVRQWGRIRCVAEGPDGLVYICSDDGKILRLRPD